MAAWPATRVTGNELAAALDEAVRRIRSHGRQGTGDAAVQSAMAYDAWQRLRLRPGIQRHADAAHRGDEARRHVRPIFERPRF